jgi:hypothetical protein
MMEGRPLTVNELAELKVRVTQAWEMLPPAVVNATFGLMTIDETDSKSDPVFLDTVWTTMTAAKEAGHEGQSAKAHHDSWQ